MNHLPLLIRREFWEHRSFFIAPAVVAAILLVIMTFAQVEFDHISLDLLGNPEWVAKRYGIITVLLWGVAFPYLISMGCLTVFYLLDSLYADRKDRSVLFWKSLPVSDHETVISKLLVAAVVLPLMTYLAVIATNLVFGIIGSIRLNDTIDHVWSVIWMPSAWFDAHVMLLYALFAMMLWYLPILGWLMLISAWARRAVILWAVLPPLALMLLEYGLFHTTYVGQVLRDRFVGWYRHAINLDIVAERAQNIHGKHLPAGHITDAIDASAFFSTPELWIGIAVAAAFIWLAIQLRRRYSET